MTRNKDNRKKLEGQYRALEEHLQKIAHEKSKPTQMIDQGLIAHWEKTVANLPSKYCQIRKEVKSMISVYKHPYERLDISLS